MRVLYHVINYYVYAKNTILTVSWQTIIECKRKENTNTIFEVLQSFTILTDELVRGRFGYIEITKISKMFLKDHLFTITGYLLAD